MTITEREWQMNNAAEHVVLVFETETGKQSHIAIMDGDVPVLDEIDKSFALALAARLTELAIELPESGFVLPRKTIEPRPALRRLASVDDELRERDQ